MALGPVNPLGTGYRPRPVAAPRQALAAPRMVERFARYEGRTDERDNPDASGGGQRDAETAAPLAATVGLAARTLLRWQQARHSPDGPSVGRADGRPASTASAAAAALGDVRPATPAEASAERSETTAVDGLAGRIALTVGASPDARAEALVASLVRDPTRLFSALQRLGERTLEATLTELGAVLTTGASRRVSPTEAPGTPAPAAIAEGAERLRAFARMAPADGVRHLLEGLRQQGVPAVEARARVAAVIERAPAALWSAEHGRPTELRLAALREVRGLDDAPQAGGFVAQRLRAALALGTTVWPTRAIEMPFGTVRA